MRAAEIGVVLSAEAGLVGAGEIADGDAGVAEEWITAGGAGDGDGASEAAAAVPEAVAGAGIVVVGAAPGGAADGVRSADAVESKILVADVERAASDEGECADAVGRGVVARGRGTDDALDGSALVGDSEIVGGDAAEGEPCGATTATDECQ